MKLLRPLLIALSLALPITLTYTPPAQAECVLRQSDAVELTLGPYVDSTDGVSAETGLTISQGDVILKKCTAGGDCAASAQKTEASACAHDANGMYECDFDATDTDTVGILEIWSFEAGAAPVFRSCLVLEEAVYDQRYAASATGAAPVSTGGIVAGSFGAGAIDAAAVADNAIDAGAIANAAIDAATFATAAIDAAAIAPDAIGSSELAASSIGASEVADGALDNATFACTGGSFYILGVTDCGTAVSADADELVLRTAAAFADNEVIGQTALISGGTTGVGQSITVVDNTGVGDILNIGAWPATTPTGTITYYLFGTASATSASGAVTIAAGGITASSFAANAIDANAIAPDAIGSSEIAADAIGSSEMAAASIGASELADNAIGAAEIADNAIDAGAIAADAITSAKIAPDSIGATEISNSAIDASAFAAGAIDANAIAPDAIGSSELAASAVDEVWDEPQAGHVTAGTFGLFLDSAVSGVSTGGVSVADIADAVWDEDATGHQTQGSFGQVLGDSGADTDSLWTLANTNLDATMSSRASQSSLNVLDVIANAIKTKTDQLTFGVANTLNVNVEYQNAAQMCGVGISADKWRACP